MNYFNINKDVEQVFWNGILNTTEEAIASRDLIQNDFGQTGLINNITDGTVNDII